MTALQASLPRGLCPELGATRALEATLRDAADRVRDAVGGGPECALARLTLTELIDELSAALVSYRALRVSAECDPRSD
ncbi:MAG: hypothetical protein R3A79_18895 [Nannocystaceae bacterium]